MHNKLYEEIQKVIETEFGEFYYKNLLEKTPEPEDVYKNIL